MNVRNVGKKSLKFFLSDRFTINTRKEKKRRRKNNKKEKEENILLFLHHVENIFVDNPLLGVDTQKNKKAKDEILKDLLKESLSILLPDSFKPKFFGFLPSMFTPKGKFSKYILKFSKYILFRAKVAES